MRRRNTPDRRSVLDLADVMVIMVSCARYASEYAGRGAASGCERAAAAGVEVKDSEIGALTATIAAQRSEFTAELAARDERLAAVDERIAALEAELARLRAQIAKNSANSSIPPSKDSIEAKAKRKKASSQRVRSKDRKPGGQPGHTGSGLEPASSPDRTERADPPTGCPRCGAGLSDAADAGASWAQIWDVPPAELEKVHWILPRRRCGCCRTTTTPC